MTNFLLIYTAQYISVKILCFLNHFCMKVLWKKHQQWRILQKGGERDVYGRLKEQQTVIFQAVWPLDQVLIQLSLPFSVSNTHSTPADVVDGLNLCNSLGSFSRAVSYPTRRRKQREVNKKSCNISLDSFVWTHMHHKVSLSYVLMISRFLQYRDFKYTDLFQFISYLKIMFIFTKAIELCVDK